MLNRNSPVRSASVVLMAFLGFYANAYASPRQGKAPEIPVVQESHRAIEVGVRPQLFAVLCALDAAGYSSNVDAASDSTGRVQMRRRMLALQGPAVSELRKFYSEHAIADTGLTFSRFVSFALAVGPPPNFEFELRRDELPPDALALEGFNQIMANFYQEAQIEKLWKSYQPEYERTVDAYRAPVSDMFFNVSNYLREILRPSSARTFSIYVELLAGKTTDFRNYGDHYELVVAPGSDFPTDEIRHALLHFLLDPMAIRYRVQAARLSPLLEIAARAPRLPAEMHDDYPAFFDECLVRAVELRMRHLAPVALASAIDQAETGGYVLVRPIYAGLTGFEKSEPAMGYYLPDLIKGIDLEGEQRRLHGVTFAEASTGGNSTPQTSSPASPKPAASSDPVDLDLAEGQRQISARNGAAAAAAFERVLSLHPNDLRATYGLAVAAALQGQPARARELFAKVIAASSSGAQNASPESGSQSDSSNLAWSHIYLGRMYDLDGHRDLAIIEYRAALAVDGLPESARAAAQRGVDTGYQSPSGDKKPDGKS